MTTKIQPNLILFLAPSKPKDFSSFFSWAIAKATKSLFSHIAVYISNNIIFHAFWFTRLDFLDWVLRKTNYLGTVSYYVDYEGFNHNKGVKALEDIMYEPYDVLRFISIAKRKLLGFIGIISQDKILDTPHAWVCQEAVKVYLINGGIPASLLQNCNSPADVARLPFIKKCYGINSRKVKK